MATGSVKPKEKSLPAHLVPGNPGNSGGKPGRSGRKPNEFIQECGQLTDELVLPKIAAHLALADPTDEAWRWAATFVSKYAKGLPTQTVEHTGKDGGPIEYIEHAKADFQSRMDRITQRLGSAAMPEGVD